MKKVLLSLLIWCFVYHVNAQNTLPTIKSDFIVEAKVVQQESFWNAEHTMILTRHTLEVYKSFKKNSPKELTLTTLGGQVGKDILKAETHHLNLDYGSAGIFLLRKKNNKFEMLADGFIRYDILNGKASSRKLHFKNIKEAIYSQFSDWETLKTESLMLPSSTENATARTENISLLVPSTITAGTQSILTINGEGFGDFPTQNANIIFSNAEDGGQTDRQLLYYGWNGLVGLSEIEEWTDTRIKVRVPSFAGTGKVTVITENQEAFTSSDELTITYALETSIVEIYDDFGNGNSFKQEATKNYLTDYNREGGYTLFVDPEFFADAVKMTSLTNSLNKFRCETGFNMSISANQAPIPWGFSGKTVITEFDGSEFGDTYTRSYTFTTSQVCNTGTELIPFVTEFQIFLNSAINWSYSGTPAPDEVDFESEILRALARTHQLAYVNDPSDIMYNRIREGEVKRTLSPTNLEAAKLMMDYSTSANNDCGLPAMIAVDNADCQNSINPPLARFEADITEACEAPLTVTFESTSRNATSYKWTFTGGTPATSSDKNPRVTYNNSGNFTVSLEAINATGTHTETKTGYIKIENGLNFTVDLGADKEICQNEEVILDAGIDSVSYLWSTGEVTRTIKVTTKGTYSVEVTQGACTSEDEINITYKNGSVDAGKSLSLCVGETAQLRGEVTGATSFSWSPSTGLSDPNSLNPTVSPTETTTYTLTAQTSACGEVKDQVTVSIKEKLSLDYFPKNEEVFICQNEEFFLDAYPNNATNPTFLWSDGSTDPYFFIQESGTYWVEVSDPNFCTFRDTVKITEVAELTVTAGEDITICKGNEVVLKAEGAAFYEWQGGDILGNPFVDQITVSPTRTTTYTVTGSGGFNGICEPKTAQVTVTVREPIVLEIGDDATVCETSFELDATVDDENATYEWEDGSTNPKRTITQSGSYAVSVNTICGVLVDAIELEFYNTTLELGDNVELCQEDFELDATIDDENAIYEWEDGSTNPKRIVTETGVYEVTVTTICGEMTDQVEVTFGNLTLNLGEDMKLCEETTLELDATLDDENATYTWEDGSTNPKRVVDENGIYSVNVTTTTCGILTDTIEVSFFEPSTIAKFEFTKLIDEVTFENKTETDYEVTYLWDFGDGNTSSDANPTHKYTQSGTYKVKLTVKAKDCSAEVFVEEELTLDFVTGIEDDNISSRNVNLYPNPSTGLSTLKWEANLGQVKSIVLFNSLGKQVNTIKLDKNLTETTINLPELPKGLYLFVIQFDTHIVHKKWLIK
jgi:PKD repeat protein